jgi:hypothetical protein
LLETQGPLLHGKRLSVALIVRVVACLTEGLGIRATARVCAVDPNTGWPWLGEAAEPLRALTTYLLCDLHAPQLYLDAWSAVIRALKAGELSEEEAIERLEGARPWVWTAIDPVSPLFLAIEVGPRTVAIAQRVVQRVSQRFASGGMPAWFSDGFKGYLPTILGHLGWWVHPERRQDKGPRPKPRWRPLPGLLYAQVVKQYRRKRVVGGKHWVVFGTLEAVKRVLAARGWTINTSFVERRTLDRRQCVAAVGRRVNTLGQSEDGVQHPLVLFHVYYNSNG